MEHGVCSNLVVSCNYRNFIWANQSNYVINRIRLLIGPVGIFKKDITIVCDGGNVDTNKLLLAIYSHYFAEFFMETPLDQITQLHLPRIPVKTFRYICQFMYDGKITVPEDEVQFFIRAGHELQVEGLKTADLESVETHFIVGNSAEVNENHQPTGSSGTPLCLVDKTGFVVHPLPSEKTKETKHPKFDESVKDNALKDNNGNGDQESCILTKKIATNVIDAGFETSSTLMDVGSNESKEKNLGNEIENVVTRVSGKTISTGKQADNKTHRRRIKLVYTYSDDDSEFDSKTGSSKTSSIGRSELDRSERGSSRVALETSDRLKSDQGDPKPSTSTGGITRPRRGMIFWNGKYYSRKAANGKDIKCPYCYKRLKLSNLDVHKAKNCKGKWPTKKAENSLDCEFNDCHFSCTDQDNLNEHIDSHFNVYICTSCDAKFTAKENYNLHALRCEPSTLN